MSVHKTQFRFEFGSIRKLCFEIWIDFCNETWTWPLKVWQIESQVEYVAWFLKFKCPHAFRLRFLTKVFFLIVRQELEIIQWFYMLRFFVKFKQRNFITFIHGTLPTFNFHIRFFSRQFCIQFSKDVCIIEAWELLKVYKSRKQNWCLWFFQKMNESHLDTVLRVCFVHFLEKFGTS